MDKFLDFSYICKICTHFNKNWLFVVSYLPDAKTNPAPVDTVFLIPG